MGRPQTHDLGFTSESPRNNYSLPQGNRFKIFFTTEYTEDTETYPRIPDRSW